MNKPRLLSHEHAMSKSSQEQVMNKSWTSHEQVKNKLGTLHGQVMNNSGTGYRQVMYKLKMLSNQQTMKAKNNINKSWTINHLGKFSIGSYLKVKDSTKSSGRFSVIVRGNLFYIILKLMYLALFWAVTLNFWLPPSWPKTAIQKTG